MTYAIIYKTANFDNNGVLSIRFKPWWKNYSSKIKSTADRDKDLRKIGCIWSCTDGTLAFETEEDATAFILRWS